MKTVFSNHMVAHVWAQQTQEHGRSHNGNFSFRGDTLFSYSTPIARFVPTPTGGRVVLVTCNSYSITTASKHKTQIGSAVNYDYFSVPFLGVSGGWFRDKSFTGDEAHAANLAYLVEQYTKEVARIRRSRNAPGEYTWEHLGRVADNAIKYANTFALAEPALNSYHDRTLIMEARAERDARNNTPQAIAARERKATRDAAKLQAIIGDWPAVWRAGGTLKVPGLSKYQRRDLEHQLRATVLLRVRGDNLETSLGATVPLAHAIKVFRFIKHVRATGQEWQRNGHAVRVGHFQLDSIAPNGDFHAGCHFIAWDEVERLARQIGVFDETPSTEAQETRELADA